MVFEENLQKEAMKQLKKYCEPVASIADIDYKNMMSKRKIIFYSRSAETIKFYTEKLIPTFRSSRPRLLLLFSNPHPESLIRGMFHSNPSIESKNFWRYLKMAGIIDLPINSIDDKISDFFISGSYKSDFQIYFNCFYNFPSPKAPDQLKDYFSANYFNNVLTPKGKEYINLFLKEYFIANIICFNQDVFNVLRNSNKTGNTNILDKGILAKDYVDNETRTTIYYVYPTSWYNPNKPRFINIEDRTVSALVDIRNDIIKNFNDCGKITESYNDISNDNKESLWHVFHSEKVLSFTKNHIVFTSAKEIKENDFAIYELMPNKIVGLFKVVKKLSINNPEYQRQLADDNMMRLCGLFPMKFQYKIEPIIQFFNRPMKKDDHPDINKLLRDRVKYYAENVPISYLPFIRDYFEKYKSTL